MRAGHFCRQHLDLQGRRILVVEDEALVGMMFEGAGFEVVDIGINNDAAAYLAALEEHQPDILGMSALLTTTMPYM